MIWTSYYGNYKGNRGIAVSNSQPKPARYINLESLNPDWLMVEAYKNGNITWKEFRKAYIRKLKKLDVHEYAKMCQGSVLLCWEKDYKQCHRKILIEWFSRAGYPCGELESKTLTGVCLYCKHFKGFSTKDKKFENAVCTKTGEELTLSSCQCHTCEDWRYWY